MNSTFQPPPSFNGSAYTSSLILNNLTLYDMTEPFQVFKGAQRILFFDQTGIVISGDFTVTGTLTTNNTVINTYAGGMLHLGSDNVADAIDLGFYGQYINGSPVYTGFVRDSSDTRKAWALFNSYTTEPTVTVNGGTAIADTNLDNLKLKTVAAVAGSASVPAFTFTTSLNTGLYLSSGTTIGIANGGDVSILIGPSAITTARIFGSTNATDAASAADTAAAISTAGGAAIAKTLWAAGVRAATATFTGALTAASAVITTATASTLNTNTLAVSASITTNAITAQTLTTSGAAAIGAGLTAAGTAALTTLTVSGTTALTGATTLGTTLAVTGNTTLGATTTAQNVNVLGNFSTTGTSSFTGLLSANSLAVSGSFTPSRVVTTSTATSSSPTDTTASLSVAGGASVAANINVGGSVTIDGNLIVSGSTISTQGSNKITGLETGTVIALNTTKCAVECSNAGAIVVNLPAFSATYKGKEFYIFKTSTTSTVTVIPNGTDTINGSTAHIGPLGSGEYVNIYVIGGETGWFTV